MWGEADYRAFGSFGRVSVVTALTFPRTYASARVAVSLTRETRAPEIPGKSTGIARASSRDMSSARQFEELICWQRIHELKTEVGKVTEHGRDRNDAVFSDPIVNAADRAERHIEEGFGRYKPRVFAAFLEFSRTAACETRSLL